VQPVERLHAAVALVLTASRPDTNPPQHPVTLHYMHARAHPPLQRNLGTSRKADRYCDIAAPTEATTTRRSAKAGSEGKRAQ